MATTTTSTSTSAPAPPPLRRTSGFAGRGTDSIVGVLVKVIGLGAVAGLVLYLTPVLVAADKLFGLVVVWVAALALFGVYATRRLVPLEYLLPGTLFLLAMIVYPIIATFGISFTNYGDGKRLSKDEAIASIVGSSVTQAPDSTLYNLTVGTTGSASEGPFTFFLVQPESGTVYEGTPEDGLTELDGATVEEDFVTAVDGYTMLTPKQVNDAGTAVSELAVPTDDGAIRSQGVRSAFEGVTNLTYDEASDTITNAETGETFSIGKVGDSDFFVGEDGTPAFSQSWKQDIGTANYERVITNDRIAADSCGSSSDLAFAILNVGLSSPWAWPSP